MADDPAAYLKRALDEAQARAEAAIPKDGTGVWDWSCPHEGMERKPPSHDLCAHLGGCGEEIDLHDDGGHSVEQAAHIAFWDPATVLRLVAADRKLLELHSKNPMEKSTRDWYLRFHGRVLRWCQVCGERPGPDVLFEGPLMEVEWPCPTIEVLAEGWGWRDGE